MTQAKKPKKPAKKKPTPASWKKGQPSPNPKGRPPEGQSWKAIIKQVSNMTPAKIVDLVGDDNDLGQAYKKMPQKTRMKVLVVLRSMAALMFDPSPSLLEHLMDRDEGKVKEELELTAGIKVDGLEQLLEKVYGNSKPTSN